MPLNLSTKCTARVGMAALACFIALGVVAWATPSMHPPRLPATRQTAS